MGFKPVFSNPQIQVGFMSPHDLCMAGVSATHTHTYALTHTKLTINNCLVGFTVGI